MKLASKQLWTSIFVTYRLAGLPRGRDGVGTSSRAQQQPFASGSERSTPCPSQRRKLEMGLETSRCTRARSRMLASTSRRESGKRSQVRRRKTHSPQHGWRACRTSRSPRSPCQKTGARCGKLRGQAEASTGGPGLSWQALPDTLGHSREDFRGRRTGWRFPELWGPGHCRGLARQGCRHGGNAAEEHWHPTAPSPALGHHEARSGARLDGQDELALTSSTPQFCSTMGSATSAPHSKGW